MSRFFQRISIWKVAGENGAVNFTCLLDVESLKYRVQSANFFRLPIDDVQLVQFEKQFVELFVESPDADDVEWFDSVAAAIAAHERDFA